MVALLLRQPRTVVLDRPRPRADGARTARARRLPALARPRRGRDRRARLGLRPLSWQAAAICFRDPLGGVGAARPRGDAPPGRGGRGPVRPQPSRPRPRRPGLHARRRRSSRAAAASASTTRPGASPARTRPPARRSASCGSTVPRWWWRRLNSSPGPLIPEPSSLRRKRSEPTKQALDGRYSASSRCVLRARRLRVSRLSVRPE